MQRLSQRSLARQLRRNGHHFPNDHLRLIAQAIGLADGSQPPDRTPGEPPERSRTHA